VLGYAKSGCLDQLPGHLRDYLRAHTSFARSVERIKRGIATQHAANLDAYYDNEDPIYDLFRETALDRSRQARWTFG
jgi:GrpB-like predicted nucleotidyltransferase (UPF0157 family)